MSFIIELAQVSRAFHHRYVLRKIDLKVNAGEVIGLTGANGSGKTTLLRILSTLLDPTSGTVRIFGKEGEETKQFRKTIGLLLTESFFQNDLSLRSNLHFYARCYQLSGAEKHIEDRLEKMNLRMVADEPVRTLSRGEKQKGAILRSLLHEPSLLLWDEPTNGLDDVSREAVTELLPKKGNYTLIYTTHEPSVLEKLTDRTLKLEQGHFA